MSDDTRDITPDSQDALWTEHEPDTERVSQQGEPIDVTPEAYVPPQPPIAPVAEPVVSETTPPLNDISPLGTAISHEPASDQYIAVGPDPVVKPKRRKWLVGLIVIGVLALLSAGAALAYNLWYQNPDKVLSDAVLHAVKAKSLTYNGSLEMNFDSAKLTVDFDGNNPTIMSGQTNLRASVTSEGQTYKLDGSSLVDKDGTLYFKVTNLRSLMDSVMRQSGATTTSFDGLIAKVDNKWVKVTADDIKQVSPGTASTRTCVTSAITKLGDDQVEQKELSDLYKKHKFIIVDKKLGSAMIADQGSLGYSLRTDTTVAKQFVEGLNDTSLAMQLKACDKSFKFDANSLVQDASGAKTNETMQVWVSRWSHDITRVSLDSTDASKQKTTVWAEPHFNNATPIATPTDALTIKQLQADIQTAFSGLMMGEGLAAEQTQIQADAFNVQKHVEAYNADMEVYPTLAQLKAGSSSVAKLPADISSRLGTIAPTAANPTAIQYQLCAKATGAYISYYDVASGAVKRLTAGVCAS